MNPSALPSRSVLDNPVWYSITGGHSHLGQIAGQAVTYHPEVSPFGGLEEPSEAALDDLATLIPDNGIAAVMTSSEGLPKTSQWKELATYHLSQMIHLDDQSAPNQEYVELSTADVPRMIELVRLTEPGPFDTRTIQFGTYLGIYSDDQLIAMAGERLRPMGWVEISGVCTHPTARGKGLAAALVKELVARVHGRGEHAFLNVLKGSPSEKTAIGVYERLGFQFHQPMTIYALLKLSSGA
jgi:predicted GNAT family acetyltransferase